MSFVKAHFFAKLDGDDQLQVDLLHEQTIEVTGDKTGPSVKSLQVSDLKLEIKPGETFPAANGQDGHLPATVGLSAIKLPFPLVATLAVHRDDTDNCTIKVDEVIADVPAGEWSKMGLTLKPTIATLSFGDAPWTLELAPKEKGPVAEMSILGVVFQFDSLKLDATGIVAGEAKASWSQSQQTIKGLNKVSVMSAEAKLLGTRCQARLKFSFQIEYFVGSEGELDVLVSWEEFGGSWQVAASTRLNTGVTWSDPSGWMTFERMGLSVDIGIDAAHQLSINKVSASGAVTFRAGSLKGAEKEWLGQLFSGLSAEFRDVALDKLGEKGFEFGFKPPGGLNIRALSIFRMNVAGLSMGLDVLKLKGLSLELENMAGTAVRGSLGELSISLKGAPSISLKGTTIEMAMSASGGVKASGQLIYLHNDVEDIVEGRGQLTTPTFPGVEVTFRIGRFLTGSHWVPTLLIYAAVPVVIPLFPGVIVRKVALGLGIHCEIPGTTRLTLAQARSQLQSGLPDASSPTSWRSSTTALTLVGRAIIASTQGPNPAVAELYVGDLTLIVTSDFQLAVLGKLWLQTSIADAATDAFQAKPSAVAMVLLDGQEPSLRVVAQTNSDGLSSVRTAGLVGKMLGVGLPATRLAFEATSTGMAMVLGPNPIAGDLGPLRVSGSSLLAFRSSPAYVYAILRSNLDAGFAASSSVSFGPVSISARLAFGFSSELVLLGFLDNKRTSLMVYGRAHVAAYVEVSLHLRIGFEIRIGLPFGRSIRISWAENWDFSLQIHVDVQLEIALESDGRAGVRGHANVSVNIMGIHASLAVPVDANGGVVDAGRARQADIEKDLANLLGTAV